LDAYPAPGGHDNMQNRIGMHYPKMSSNMLFGPIHLCLVWAQAAMLEPMLFEPQLYIGFELGSPSLRGVF